MRRWLWVLSQIVLGAGGRAGAGKDGGVGAVGQIKPEERRQLIPDIGGAAFQHSGDPAPTPYGFLIVLR